MLWIVEVLAFLYRQYQFYELDLRPLVWTFKTAWKLTMWSNFMLLFWPSKKRWHSNAQRHYCVNFNDFKGYETKPNGGIRIKRTKLQNQNFKENWKNLCNFISKLRSVMPQRTTFKLSLNQNVFRGFLHQTENECLTPLPLLNTQKESTSTMAYIFWNVTTLPPVPTRKGGGAGSQ